MGKLMDGLRGLLKRRKASPGEPKGPDVEAAGQEDAVGSPLAAAEPLPDPAPAPVDPAPAEPAYAEPPPAEAAAGDPAAAPAPATPEVPAAAADPEPRDAPAGEPAADGDRPETLPVPAARQADLVFTVTGTVGRPGVDLSYRHVDIDTRARDRFPEALYPADVRAGEYVLDVTGHALSFGPPGRTGAHVLVPVRTRKDSADSMPANALGNALVPIETRIIDRIDRETAASKTRLRRPPVVAIAFRDAASAGSDPGSDAADPDPIDVPLAEPDGGDDGALPTSSEERAREDLAAMGYLLAQQTFTPPAQAEGADGDADKDDRGEGKDGASGQGVIDAAGIESIPQDVRRGENAGENPAPGSDWAPTGAYGR